MTPEGTSTRMYLYNGKARGGKRQATLIFSQEDNRSAVGKSKTLNRIFLLLDIYTLTTLYAYVSDINMAQL